MNYLNQAGALMLIYTDGSALVSHAGMEMGQGLHTKMMQVVCAEIPYLTPDMVHIEHTSTDKVPNTSATAASTGSDLNGRAVQVARNVKHEYITGCMPHNHVTIGTCDG